MKIIFVCQKFIPEIGGIERHVYEIARRLAEDESNEVYVYATDPSGKLPKKETIDKIEVRRFPAIAPNEAYFFSPELYLALRKERADIIHAHSFHAFPSYFSYLAFSKKKYGKFIFTPHYHPMSSSRLRDFFHLLYDPFQSIMLKKADKVICVSDYEIGLLRKRFGITNGHMINIPNGISVERFDNHKADVQKDDGTFSLLYVGRLERYKRAQWIIEAMERLSERYPERELRLVIVGKGPYEEELKTQAESLGSKVVFKKDLTDEEILEEYDRCDVFVMPSEYEAFSIVTLEALSSGKPVIVSNVGFLKEISNGNGFTIDDVDGLVDAVSFIIENGFEVKFDRNRYSWKTIVARTMEVYKGQNGAKKE